MRKNKFIDYTVLMAVRSGRKKKQVNKGLMQIAKAFEENQEVQKPKPGRTFGLPYEKFISRA